MHSLKKLTIFGLVLLFTSNLFGQAEPVSSLNISQAKLKDQEAKKFLREYRYQKAIAKYSEALTLHPLAEYAVKQGDVYFMLDKWDKASESYKMGVALDTTSGLSYLGVANCIINTNTNSDLLDHYIDKALHYCSSNVEQAEALTTLTKLKISEGEFPLAEKYIVAANKLDPENTKTQAVYASVLFELDEKEKAVEILEEIVEKENNNILYMINLGYLYNHVNRYQDALKVLDRALFYEPENPYVLANKAYTLYKTNNPSKAKKAAEKSIKNDQSNAYGHFVKGLLDLENNDLPKACRSFNKALDRSSIELDRSYKEIREAVEQNCDNPNKI